MILEVMLYGPVSVRRPLVSLGVFLYGEGL